MARRPSDEWRRKVEEEAAKLAQGSLSPDEAYASHLWPKSLRVGTDAALAAFEAELHDLVSPSDEDVLGLVERVVLALNKINEQHVRAGETGYETGEREELCEYIDVSLREARIDVEALTARQGMGARRSRTLGETGKRRPLPPSVSCFTPVFLDRRRNLASGRRV